MKSGTRVYGPAHPPPKSPTQIAYVTAALLWGMVSFGGREPREIEVVTRRWRRNHQLAVVARRGRNGVGVIRPHLAEHLMVSKITDSYLESLFFRGLGERGIPLPEPQFPVLRDDNGVVCRLDFAYPGVRVGIALDGMEFHTSRERFRIDRAQHNEAELLGWLVLRYTWWDVSGGMDRTVNQLRQALRLRGMAA